MASLTMDKGRRGRVLFIHPDGNRRTVRLGKVPRRDAEKIRDHIGWLVEKLAHGTNPPPETHRWLAGVDETLRDRLERVGLVETQERKGRTLGDVVAAFKQRPQWKARKESTRVAINKALRYLVNHFGEGKALAKITEAAAADYRATLLLPKIDGGVGLAKSTTDAACSTACALFKYAVQDRIIDSNPFAEVPHRISAVGSGSIVSDADARKVLAELPGSEMRLLFGLGRWGGLRVPSEPIRLRWCDIDWQAKRFLVHCSKTEHHDGKATRWVPMFPELAELFEERIADVAEPWGDEPVLPIMRTCTGSKLSHIVARTIDRVGVKRWPRLWHSMRSTRETELAERFPLHVVCEWIGNSLAIAQRHYLKVTSEHFEEAAQKAAQTGADSVRRKRTKIANGR